MMHANQALPVERSVLSPTRSMWTRDLALPFEPWAVLWAVALATPWLLPTHMIPWRAFHADLLMALVLLPAACWAVLSHPSPVLLPRSVLGVLAVACVPALQSMAGMITFAGDAWIAGLYLLAFALAIATGARFEHVAPGRLVDVLASALVIAGIVSVGIALAQWLQLGPLRLWDFDLILRNPGGGYRPFGNLGQSNHLATLLVWSLIALWWAFLSCRVRGAIAIGVSAFLIVGVTATQSRTAWLELIVLLAGAALWQRRLSARRSAPALVGLALFAILAAMGWEGLNRALEHEAVRAMSDQVSSPGLRPAAWKLFTDAVLLQPWTGWGWNQIALAQSTTALDHPSLHYTFHSTHNLFLDLLVQNGLPLGLLMALGLVAWMVIQARRVDTPAGCLLWLAIAVLAVHAMLEFPQNYAYFLLPAGLMAGAIEASHPVGRPLRIQRAGAAGVVVLVSLLTAWVAVEYHRAERSLEQLRFERARVGPSRNSQPPDLLVLTQLRDFLRALHLRPVAGMTEDQVELMQRVTRQYPSDGNHLMLAAIEAQNGKAEQAGITLRRMCRMVPDFRCRDALTTWREMAKTSPLLQQVQLEPRH